MLKMDSTLAEPYLINGLGHVAWFESLLYFIIKFIILIFYVSDDSLVII